MFIVLFIKVFVTAIEWVTPSKSGRYTGKNVSLSDSKCGQYVRFVQII